VPSSIEVSVARLTGPRSAESIRNHLEAALDLLKLNEELDRLMNPRHTDHDRHVYLPRKVADQIAAARHEIEAALDALD
jgi:hypothetical protein